MKKILALIILAAMTAPGAIAQESKAAAKERHKNYWKKVGTDTRDFWKGEHDRKVKKKEEKERKRAGKEEQEDRGDRKEHRKPPNPFKKKNKQEPNAKTS